MSEPPRSADAPVFTYWDGDAAAIAEQVGHWRAQFPGYRVVTRDQARALLAARSPQALEAFDRIALPACRSDLARLLWLEAHGGLYVDAHCAILDAAAIRGQSGRLNEHEAVVSTRWAPNFGKVMPHNSILWSRPGAPVTTRLLDIALGNLVAKAEQERRRGHEPYHVWDLTGPGVLWRELFDTDAADGRLVEVWQGRIGTVFEADNPVRRHVFTGYRAPGQHWSERQRSERLFL